MRSPSMIPALAAGEPGMTWPIMACMSASEMRLVLHHVTGPVSTPTASTIFMKGPGEGDDQTLPARFGQEAARIVRIVLIGHLLAGHLDVAAEQDQRKAVVGFPAAEAEEARAKAEAEGFHLDVEESGRPEMARNSWIIIMTPIRTSSHRTFSKTSIC